MQESTNGQPRVNRERVPALRIGGDHGYRIDGDTVSVHADLLILGDPAQRAQWAVQLWACDRPHDGGPVAGLKIAEIPVALPPSDVGPLVCLAGESAACVPWDRREYAMVLVLASRAPGGAEEVCDFANYPRLESFPVPLLEGSVGYSILGDSVVLRVDGVINPRARGNLSGSLALELRAAAPADSGRPPEEGLLLARADLGRIGGQSSLGPLQYAVPLSWPPAGRWLVALLLSEWTAGGFATRDLRTFAAPLESAREAPAGPDRDAIALAAYHRYVARGRAPGRHEEDWLAAERELLDARAGHRAP